MGQRTVPCRDDWLFRKEKEKIVTGYRCVGREIGRTPDSDDTSGEGGRV
jgi:hypothetical protein